MEFDRPLVVRLTGLIAFFVKGGEYHKYKVEERSSRTCAAYQLTPTIQFAIGSGLWFFKFVCARVLEFFKYSKI